MRNYLIFLIAFTIITGCSKQFNVEGKLYGIWNLTEHTIDGVSQDTTMNGIRLDFGVNHKGSCARANSFDSFKYYYYNDTKTLHIRYSTNWVDELELLEIDVIPGALSYSDPEAAPEQFMRLKNGNQEFKFVKVYED